MKLLTVAAACAAVVTLTAAPAFAEPVIAKLAQPVAQAEKILAGEAMFSCAGDTCVAITPQSQTFATAACKTIAAKFGTVTSYTWQKPMDAERLTACNAGAAHK